jgi:hypothetical protein
MVDLRIIEHLKGFVTILKPPTRRRPAIACTTSVQRRCFAAAVGLQPQLLCVGPSIILLGALVAIADTVVMIDGFSSAQARLLVVGGR